MLGHYGGGVERDRLDRAGHGALELIRTQELLRRHLPPPPASILDVGGGPGAHARWLQAGGHDVRIVDPVPLHVDQARAAGCTADVGDARSLDAGDASMDVVLLLGPLYHLTERDHRARALSEAARVVRPGGLVAVAAVSRVASLLDGFASGHHADPAFRAMVERDLRNGLHRAPSDRPDWFTTAYFHRVDELDDELVAAGLVVGAIYGIEGPGWLFRGSDGVDRELDLWAARLVEQDPLFV